MSDPGKGAPVDDLDRLCKGYKECLRCARREHGDQCIGEFMQYKFAIRKKNVVCRDATGTCERDLCECDAMFAKGTGKLGCIWDFLEDFRLFRSWTFFKCDFSSIHFSIRLFSEI